MLAIFDDRLEVTHAAQQVTQQVTQHATQQVNQHQEKDLLPVQLSILEMRVQPTSRKEIMNRTGYKDRNTIPKYLEDLIQRGMLQRTIPDKPKSQFQMYIAVGKTHDECS